MKVTWYKRKDKVTVCKIGKWKVLEIKKRLGGFWCCIVFKKGVVVAGEGFLGSSLPKKYHAIRWGCKKARELGLWVN